MLFEEIREWAGEKGILEKGTKEAQFEKFSGECFELLEEVREGNIENIRGELADVIVTLVILAEMYGFDAEDALEDKLEVLWGRTGKMVDGVFVKDK